MQTYSTPQNMIENTSPYLCLIQLWKKMAGTKKKEPDCWKSVSRCLILYLETPRGPTVGVWCPKINRSSIVMTMVCGLHMLISHLKQHGLYTLDMLRNDKAPSPNHQVYPKQNYALSIHILKINTENTNNQQIYNMIKTADQKLYILSLSSRPGQKSKKPYQLLRSR